MNVRQLLHRARAAGMTITLDGDRLRVRRPRNVEADLILAELKRHKAAVQALLKAHQCAAGVTPCGQPGRLYPAGWRCEEHKPGQGVYPIAPRSRADTEQP